MTKNNQISKETLRRSGQYIPPEKPSPLKEIPTIYKPYYLLEKNILEPVDAWISKQAFFTECERESPCLSSRG